MKNFIKRCGFITLVAVIAFSFVACGDEDGSNNGGSGGTGGGSGGQGYRIASVANYGSYQPSQPTLNNYYYDSKGFNTRTEAIDSNGALISAFTFFYNDSGWRIRQEVITAYGAGSNYTDYEYEFGENLVRTISRPSYSSASITESIWSGDQIIQEDIYIDGTLVTRLTQIFDSSGRIAYTQYEFYRSGSPITYMAPRTYDSNGRLINYTSTSDGILIYTHENSYNSNGRLLISTTTYPDGMMIRQEYTYESGNGYNGSPDPHGNVRAWGYRQ